jgi:hypothetical protein
LFLVPNVNPKDQTRSPKPEAKSPEGGGAIVGLFECKIPQLTCGRQGVGGASRIPSVTLLPLIASA